MWKELLEEEKQKLVNTQKEFDYQLELWKKADTISQKQRIERYRVELKDAITQMKMNVETYRLTAIEAGEIEPENEAVEEVETTPVIEEVTKEPEMTPQEAMQILMSLTNSNLINKEVEEDDAYDEKDNI